MDKVREIPAEYGYYLFKLEQVLYDKKISINRLIRDTNTDFKVIKRIMTGDISRIDIDVISRLCHYLECEFYEIIEYRNK